MMSSLEPQTTAWLDVTKSDEGLCVAWNSARYLLTTEQARRMVETLSSLLAEEGSNQVKSREMEQIMSTIDISTMTKGELVEEIDRQLVDAMSREPAKD